MERDPVSTGTEMTDFTEIVKKAYHKGLSETDLTLAKLMEQLETDLKNMIVD